MFPTTLNKSINNFSGHSDGKEFACNVGDLGLIPGLGWSPGEGNGYPLQYSCLEKSHGPRSLVGYSPWGCKASDMIEQLTLSLTFNKWGNWGLDKSMNLKVTETSIFASSKHTSHLTPPQLWRQRMRPWQKTHCERERALYTWDLRRSLYPVLMTRKRYWKITRWIL